MKTFLKLSVKFLNFFIVSVSFWFLWMAPQVHSFDFPMCLDEGCIKMRFLQENCQNSFSVGQKYNLHYIKNSCLELFL